jgi:hypothetical protein
MKLIPPAQILEDVHEYAAYKGFLRAAEGKDLCPNLFTHESELGQELRACYELGYDMEKSTRLFEETCSFEVSTTIISYKESTGWGTVSLDNKNVPFSYHVVVGDWISSGEPAVVTFEYYNGRIKITSIKTIQHSLWTTTKVTSPKDV